MADAKTTALTELTTFSGDETFYVVEDDDGTPASRRVTVENLVTGLVGQGQLIVGDGSIETIVALTQAEYDALSPPDATTYYIITDADESVALTGWQVVDSEVLSGTTASVTLDAPSTPKALRLTCSGLRSTDTGDTDRVLLLQMNADGGTNYGWVRIGESTNGTDTVSTGNAADDTGATSMQLTPIPTSLTNTTRAGICTVQIDHHAEAEWKAVTAQGYAKKSNAENQLAYTAYGTWKSTSRITSLTVTPSAGSWAAGGQFVLEGLFL